MTCYDSMLIANHAESEAEATEYEHALSELATKIHDEVKSEVEAALLHGDGAEYRTVTDTLANGREIQATVHEVLINQLFAGPAFAELQRLISSPEGAKLRELVADQHADSCAQIIAEARLKGAGRDY